MEAAGSQAAAQGAIAESEGLAKMAEDVIKQVGKSSVVPTCYSFVLSFVRSFLRYFRRSFVQSFIRTFVELVRSFIRSLVFHSLKGSSATACHLFFVDPTEC